MWARHAWRREQSRRANGCGQNIFLRRRQSRPQAGVDGEPAAGGGKCKVGPPKEAAVGIGTCTTRAPLDEPKRGQLGPTILLDRSRPAPHSPPPSDFLAGTPRVETRKSRRANGCGQNLFHRRPPSLAARRQALTVSQRRAEGNAKSAHPKKRRWESVHVQRALRWMSRSEGNWGPRFCSTAPAQHPTVLRHQIFLRARLGAQTVSFSTDGEAAYDAWGSRAPAQ